MSFRGILLVAAVLLLIAPLGVMAQDEPLPDLGGRVVTIAIENAYPPFNYLEDDGTAVGWDYAVIGEICIRLNCVPEYIETAWDGLILAVSRGEFDMSGNGITVTEERAEIVDFSSGYVVLEQVLLVRLGEDRFSTADEFIADESLRVGVQTGTTNFFTAEDLLGEDSPRIVAFDTFQIAVQAVIAGDIDAAIIDDVAGERFVRISPDQVRVLDDRLTAPEELAFIFPKNSDLTAAVNLALDSMWADDTLYMLNQRWFAGAED